jgi:hypothetical protein
MMRSIRPAAACFALVLALGVGLAEPTRALSATGTGALTSRVRLAAKGCGRFRGTGQLTVALVSDDTWMATDDDGLVFGGPYVPTDATGRTFDLDLDVASVELLGPVLAGNLGALCQAAVEVTAMERKRLRLGLNRASTKAKLKLEYRLIGTANGQPVAATLKLKAGGPWLAVAAP